MKKKTTKQWPQHVYRLLGLADIRDTGSERYQTQMNDERKLFFECDMSTTELYINTWPPATDIVLGGYRTFG